MSRNELNSFYQNAKREVQRAIANAKMCEDKLDQFFCDVNRQLTKENPRSRGSKDNFKKAVKQFNLISELFFAINLELLEVPESTESTKNVSIEELEEEMSKIPALLPSEKKRVPVKQIEYSNENKMSLSNPPTTDSDLNSFEKNSKFLTGSLANSENITNTPPLTPRKEVPQQRLFPVLRRPKEVVQHSPLVQEKSIPYRQVDVSKFKTDFKFRGYISHIQVSSFGLVFVCEVSSENFKAINDLSSDFKDNPGKYSPMTKMPEENTLFGIVLEDIFIRGVRQITPTCDQIYLVDSGEIIMCNNDLTFYKLPEKFQRFPGLAFFAQIVSCKGSSEFDVEEILEKCEFCSFDFNVVSCEDELIFLDVEGFKVLPGLETEPEPVDVPEMVVTPAQREILMEEPLNTSNAMKAVTGYNPRDDKNLCKFTSPVTGSCFKGANCKKIHLKQLDDGWTRDTDTIAAIEIASKMDLPAIGTTIKVVPVFIADSHIIYCHFDSEDQQPDIKYMELHLNNPEEQKMLLQYKFPTSIPCLHELVLAKFSDGKWYRARIVDAYPEDDSYRVLFVDYGNSWTVQLSNLRKWATKFGYLPFQAVCVNLYGVRPIAAKRAEAMDYLDTMIFDKTLKGLVKNNTNELTLDLYDMNGNRILDDYLSAGLVEKKPMYEGEFDKMTNIPA
ncbi:hypothetical protein ACFFRR_000577 [Megaselia abdita]